MTKWIVGYQKVKVYMIRKDLYENSGIEDLELPFADIIELHDDEKGD